MSNYVSIKHLSKIPRNVCEVSVTTLLKNVGCFSYLVVTLVAETCSVSWLRSWHAAGCYDAIVEIPHTF